MSNLTKLYDPQNATLLETISVFNAALSFDASVAEFKQSDLFSFLERLEAYDYQATRDDISYMLDMLDSAFRHIANHINAPIKRTHKMMALNQAKELDSKSVAWIGRQNGYSIKQKLSKGKVLGVRRFNFIDTPENRVLKIVLMRLVAIGQFREFDKIATYRRFIKDKLNEVDHRAVIKPNNVLLHHKHYRKFYKVYKWLNHLENLMSDFEIFKEKILKTREVLKEYIALSLLHKYTHFKILPSPLKTSPKRYFVEKLNQKRLIDKLPHFDSNITTLLEYKDEVLTSIQADKNLKRTISPGNPLQSSNEPIFMDIFRLYPLVFTKQKSYTMPLLLKQQIKGNTLNANHTKIINLDNEIFTLSDSLLCKNDKSFSAFMEDIRSFIGESNKLFYILPDYVNIFDFNNTHKSIRSYFSESSFIYKSFLPAAKKLFNNELKKGDTLIYLQKNNHGEVFVTPILVRYKKELEQCISKGLYLEKHPTRKIASVDFNDEIEQKVFQKCLQNGIKALIKNNVILYKNGQKITLSQRDNKMHNDINKIKSLYKKSTQLFRENIEFINDNASENLIYFEKLIEQKRCGFTLFVEHLPSLAMEVESGIETIKFPLVDDNSKMDSQNFIHVKESLEIPANQEKVEARLFFDNTKIPYFMRLESSLMPFKEALVCDLKLEYSYENEDIYTLIFTPKNNDIPPLKAKWIQGAPTIQKDLSNIYPPYPPIKSIEELQNHPKKDGDDEHDLFKWVQASIKRVEKTLSPIQAEIYRIKNGYCFARDDNGDEIHCSRKLFVNSGDRNEIELGKIVFLVKQEGDNGYWGKYISLDNGLSIKAQSDAQQALSSARFPMISIFNGHSLNDSDMPVSLRDCLYKFFNFMKSKLDKGISHEELRKELLFFFSVMHDCSPIGKYLSDSDNAEKIDSKLLAYSLGSIKQDWQKEVFNKVLDFEVRKKIKILATALWRSESLVFKIEEQHAKDIIKSIVLFLNRADFKTNNTDLIARNIEVLLSLLRLRQKGFEILNPADNATTKLLEKLNNESKQSKIKLKSYLQLQLDKPDKYKNMPNLIYALISFIKGENTNQIQILGVKDE